MTDYIIYTVDESGGGRLDSLAYLMYGDPYGYERIIRANPGLMYATAIAPGTAIKVPVIDAVPNSVPQNLLPPWKQ